MSSMSISPETLARAEACKEEGNKQFAARKYIKALDLYSEALEYNPRSEIYLSNRAFTHIRLENYGSAISDASAALEINPNFVKAYYRRGSAYLALGKFKLGLQDFRRVVAICPRDADAATKLRECEKEVKRIAFETAIAGEAERAVSETIDLSAIVVDSDYAGPLIPADGISDTFVRDMMEHFRAQKLIHRRDAFRILLDVKPLLMQTPNIQEVSVQPGDHVTVCGDIHGQYYDLLNIFKLNGTPSPSNPYVFNGDFVDRGSFSVEVILTLLAFKVLYPTGIFLTRGNHESRHLNTMYGFSGEVKSKYSEKMYQLFSEIFTYLPLGTLINKKVFCVHGGLFSKDGVQIADIQKIDRFREPPDDGPMCEMLWSDPQPMQGRGPSKRGVAIQFGPDVTQRFLADNGLSLVVRSHEVKPEGYEIEAGGKLITVFSAPNYCDQVGNKGAFIRFEHDMQPKITTFEAVPHPTVKPMAYAGSGLMNFL